MKRFFTCCMFLQCIFCIFFHFSVKSDDDVTNTFFKFEHAEASSTFPSIGEHGLPEYAAENALTKGSGYWCSEGKHNANDVVTWTGHLKNVRSLNGVIVHWAYAPGDVAVFASYDGKEPFEEVTPFQVIESRAGSVVQNIIFNHVIRAKSIRLHMRVALNEYFGINFVSVIGSKDPTLRIQSGMTSIFQDLCLQIDETNEVVLDGCINAVAYLDGRDLWKLNAKNQIYNPITNLCITLKDNLVANGGKIIVADCNAGLEHNDGRSVWQLLPNNQLKLLRTGNFCLSQEGSKSGSLDVAFQKEVTSTLSRQDKNFAPEKAVDGNIDSYWASQGFSIDTTPDAVYFEVNLGGVYKLQKVIIDWKYPATKYSVLLSKDGQNFDEVSSNLANFLRSTINNLHNVEAQFVKLKLLTPNPEYAEEEELFYGIKKFSVYSNRIRSIVEDCDKAKDSEDARDKYFFEFVSEVHLKEGTELKRLDHELQQFAEKIQTEGLKIQQLNPKLKKCKTEKEKRQNEINNIKNVILKNIYDVIYQTQNIIKTYTETGTTFFSTSTKELGQIPENPADSCFHLQQTLPHLVSGFYYILPACSQNVLRVFCDMQFGATYHVPDVDTSLIKELKDVENACATYGLYPIHINHEHQVHTLKNLFHIIDLNITNPVPLGIRTDTDTFFSLDLQENINDVVKTFGTPTANTFGVNHEGVIFFDSANSEMSGIVCSDNVNTINVPETFVHLTCTTTLKESNDIKKVVGSEYLVKCPQDCLEREVEASIIGGEGNVYSEESSICLSAIHAGVYDKHHLVHLRVINAPDEFEGVFQNGIVSDSYVNEGQEFAVTLFTVPQKCPSGAFVTDFSFLQTDHDSVQKGVSGTEGIINNDMTIVSEDETLYVDSSTADAINDLVTIMNKQVGSTDPTFLGLISKQVIKIVSNARRYLKPTEVFEKNIDLLANETLKDVQKVSHQIKLLSAKIHSELDKGKYKLETLIDERMKQTEFDSWKLEHVENVHDVFEVVNSNHLQNSGKWEIYANPVESGVTGISLIQNARVVGQSTDERNVLQGTFAFLRYKSFYDFVFSTYVHVKGTGSVGVLFRAYDKYNYYLFEINNSGGSSFRRLLKVEHNDVTELAVVKQSDLDEGSWFAIRIECRSSQIKITTIKTTKLVYDLPDPDIVVTDDFNAAGTIGFFSHAVDKVHFTKTTVESMDCLTKDSLLNQVASVNCNIYEEYFVSKFDKSYTVLDPENATGGPSQWSFANDVGNEKKVILQKSDIKGDPSNEVPSLIILQNKMCDAGVFKFSFYPQCAKQQGLVGAVIKFTDPNNYTILEVSPTFTRLRQNVNGVFQVLGKSIISGYKENIWNRVTISFSSNNVNVNMGSGVMTYPIFGLIGLNLQKGNSIGFSSYNCNGVAISNVFLHPLDFKPYRPIPSVGMESMVPMFDKVNKSGEEAGEERGVPTSAGSTETEIGKHSHGAAKEQVQRDIHFCTTYKNIVDRVSFCNDEGKHNPNCVMEFCSTCCTTIETEDPEDVEKCEQLCHKIDDHVVKTSEVVKFLKESCVDSPSENAKQSCEHEDNKQKCLSEMCQMCCHSVTLPPELVTKDMDVNALVEHCVTLCV